VRDSPLLTTHQGAGARLVEYAAWRLPVEFTSVAEEARATRRAGALFDVSHMGNLVLRGPGAVSFARKVLTRDIASVPVGCSAYALLCDQAGCILDDLIAMVVSPEEVRLVVNASHHDQDVAWLKEHLTPSEDVQIEDLRGRSFGLALQGPRSEDILESAGLSGGPPDLFATFRQMQLGQAVLLVSRTGYTGEDGFELFGAAEDAPGLWQLLLDAGREHGLVPAGLAARDVLRQEMGYPLAGHDFDEQTTPMEAGLGWVIDRNRDFVGRSALEGSTPARRRICFAMQEQGVARRGAAIHLCGEQIGTVTSGTYSHNLGAAIGQGYVSTSARPAPGTEVEIVVRGKLLRARFERAPLIPRKTRPSWVARQRRETP
jgi:aminomethyltransferase